MIWQVMSCLPVCPLASAWRWPHEVPSPYHKIYNQPACLSSPHCWKVSHFPFQKSLEQLRGAKVYWHSRRWWWRLMKEKFCGHVCVNFWMCALFQLCPIYNDKTWHGTGSSKPRKRPGRVTTASIGLQNYFLQRFRNINTVRRVAFVLLFHLLSTYEILIPHPF